MRISDWSSDVCSSDLEIHGALICIEDGLAQFMEGESEDLRAVIASQQLDWWHLSGITAFDDDIGETRFPDWSTAYAGASYFLAARVRRSEEHTSELQSLMRNAYGVFCVKKTKEQSKTTTD